MRHPCRWGGAKPFRVHAWDVEDRLDVERRVRLVHQLRADAVSDFFFFFFFFFHSMSNNQRQHCTSHTPKDVIPLCCQATVQMKYWPTVFSSLHTTLIRDHTI